MNDQTKDILRMIAKLGELDSMNVTCKESGKAGIITGICTIAGGLFGGRLGVAVGGLAGTAISSYLIQEEFLTVKEIIKDKMSDEQRENLAGVVKNILNICPIPGALSVILSNDNLRSTIVTAIVSHVQNIGYSPKY